MNRKLAYALREIAPPSLKLEEIAIGDLPLYNPDLENAPPSSWAQLRARIKRANAVLFVTPEYNRSVPAVLKNALDVASRPHGHNAWDGKPGAVISGTPGPKGGFGANHHLRQSLVYLNVPTLQQPEAYIGGLDKLLNAEGKLADDHTRKFLGGVLAAFEKFIAANSESKPL